MRAVRLIRFGVIDPTGEHKLVCIDSRQLLKLATGLKKAGYKIKRDSFTFSDTIVMGYTNIIKGAA